jgi:hypothetical protein
MLRLRGDVPVNFCRRDGYRARNKDRGNEAGRDLSPLNGKPHVQSPRAQTAPASNEHAQVFLK